MSFFKKMKNSVKKTLSRSSADTTHASDTSLDSTKSAKLAKTPRRSKRDTKWVKLDVPLQYNLHRAAFDGDATKINSLIADRDAHIDEQDIHGNTALTIAIWRGHDNCVLTLLEAGAKTSLPNVQGWTPLDEAVSMADKSIVTAMVSQLWKRAGSTVDKSGNDFAQLVQEWPDLSMVLNVTVFDPNVPTLSLNDTWCLKKWGDFLSVTANIFDVSTGTISTNRDGKPITLLVDAIKPSITICDHSSKRAYRVARTSPTSSKTDESSLTAAVDRLMSTPLTSTKVLTDTFNIEADAKTEGFLTTKVRQRAKQFGDHKGRFYHIKNLSTSTRTRQEHLTSNRRALSRPPTYRGTFDIYNTGTPGVHPPIGRPMMMKQTQTPMEGTLAMCQEHLLTIEHVLAVLKHGPLAEYVGVLRNLWTTNMPKGFPVMIELSNVHAGMSARVTMTECTNREVDDWEKDMFLVPKEYKEMREPIRMPF